MVTPDGNCTCSNCVPAHFVAERYPGGPYLDEEQARYENEVKIAREAGIEPTADTTDEELAEVIDFPYGKHAAPVAADTPLPGLDENDHHEPGE